MAALVLDVACFVFIGEKTFSTSQSNRAFIWDKCCSLNDVFTSDGASFLSSLEVSVIEASLNWRPLMIWTPKDRRLGLLGLIKLLYRSLNWPLDLCSVGEQLRFLHPAMVRKSSKAS